MVVMAVLLSNLSCSPLVFEKSGIGREISDESYFIARDAEGNETEWKIGLAPPPPEHLPIAQIVNQSLEGEIIAEGLPYFVQWKRKWEVEDLQNDEESFPDAWPEAVHIEGERKLRFMTDVRTHLVMVAGFDSLDPDGLPIEDEQYSSYRCVHSNRNPCSSLSPRGFIEYNVPQDVLQHRYISVFAMWSIPPKVNDGNIVPPSGRSFVNANWLFHLAND